MPKWEQYTWFVVFLHYEGEHLATLHKKKKHD
jgi:hypothetical protein